MKKEPYPPWAVFIGVMLTLISIAFIPLLAFLRYFKLLPIDTTKITLMCPSKRTFKRPRDGVKVYFARSRDNYRVSNEPVSNGHYV